MTPTLEERWEFFRTMPYWARDYQGNVRTIMKDALAALREKDAEIARLKEALRNSMPIRPPQPGDSYNIEVDKA